AKLRCRSVLRPFLAEIDAALMAATAVVSRAGASSIAELAAMRLPSLLIPLPTAQDNHQFFNAQALAGSGAAVAVDQDRIHAADFALAILRVVTNPVLRQSLSSQIGSWHVADSAERIATRMLQLVEAHRRGLDSTAGASGDAPARRTVSKKRTEVTA
ncbi:MAG TPA: glycosyltransferase, partial [Candidatus Limnocylindria bacterium]|nr:glycosyltransferase [Candidatus Limnocylindria bacterium]